jgi:hypothetical protein
VQVRNLAAMSFTALAVIAARRCVLSMLLSWRSDVPLNDKLIGGVSRLVQLGKLVAAGECPCESSLPHSLSRSSFAHSFSLPLSLLLSHALALPRSHPASLSSLSLYLSISPSLYPSISYLSVFCVCVAFV